jgi:hypothetical protein
MIAQAFEHGLAQLGQDLFIVDEKDMLFSVRGKTRVD